MYHALKRAESRERGNGGEIIHTDSLYAKNMATGNWMPKKGHRNAEMIAGLRRAWRRVQRRRPGEVHIRHVRSHVKVPGNELADWLADRGTKSVKSVKLHETAKWMLSWLEKHKEEELQDPP